jgi:hypothetical protein
LLLCFVYSNRSLRGEKEIIFSSPHRIHLSQCPMRKKYKFSSSPISPIQEMKKKDDDSKKKKVVVVTKVVYVFKPKDAEAPVSGVNNKWKQVDKSKDLVILGDENRSSKWSKNKGSIKKTRKSRDNVPKYDFDSNYWKKRKPKLSENFNDSKDYSEEDSMWMNKRASDWKIPKNDDSFKSKRQSDFKIMERETDFDGSNLLLNRIMEEEQEDESSWMGMKAMKVHKGGIYDDIDDSIKEVAKKKKRGRLSKMKKRINKAFNSSFEDPISRLFVAIALGLITTLGVYAVISTVKTLIAGNDEFKFEKGKRESGPVSYQYTPIPSGLSC